MDPNYKNGLNPLDAAPKSHHGEGSKK
jgi:hypothetical protein